MNDYTKYWAKPVNPRMERGRGGREGGREEVRTGRHGEREAGRSGGARAKPGNQLVTYISVVFLIRAGCRLFLSNSERAGAIFGNCAHLSC